MLCSILFLFAYAADGAGALSKRSPTQLPVTDNVLELTAAPCSFEKLTPSSKHLAQHRYDLFAKQKRRRQAISVQEDLLTVGGRIYMTNATIGGRTFALVIDSGSADTWVITSDFQCINPMTYDPISYSYCGFGRPFNVSTSSTFQPIDYEFDVNYTGGEFLLGYMGVEEFGIGRLSKGGPAEVKVNQTIGVVDRGYWNGDRISSGLMGLAFPALANGVNPRVLNYTSVVFTLLQNPLVQPIFSLALNRPTTRNPKGGGVMAFGGIPDVNYDGDFVTVPIQPVFRSIYGYYSIIVDGVDIIPPNKTSTSLSQLTKRATSYFETRSNAKRQDQFSTTRNSMLIDSGTSLLYLPDSAVDYIASLFDPPAKYNSQTGLYLASCTARAPRVGIIIGGKSFYMQEDDLMNRGPGAVGGPSVGAQRGQCVLAVQRAQGGSYVLGDAWMRNVLVVFDLAKGRDFGPGGSDRNGDGGGNVRIAARENY